VIAEQKRRHLYVGLGNPGIHYQWTRHNLGFLVVKEFAKQNNLIFKQDSRYQAELAKGMIRDKEVHLLLPLTFMNLSGIAVKKYIHEKSLSLDEVTVVVDDVALLFKDMRLRLMGSSGGHNGLKSLEAHLQSRGYQRLRMGIGCENLRIPLENYVLQSFSEEEMSDLEQVVKEGAKVLDRLIDSDVSIVMNEVNKKNQT